MHAHDTGTIPTTAELSVADAARMAGVTPTTIRRWIKRGYLPGVETSAGWRVSGSHVALAQAEVRAAARRTRIPAAAAPESQSSEPRLQELAAENERLGQQVSDLLAEREALQHQLEELAVRTTATPAATTATAPAAPARAETVVAGHSQRRLAEGIQRSIVLEEARLRRALRQRDRELARVTEFRLVELRASLVEAQQRAAWELRAQAAPQWHHGAWLAWLRGSARAAFPNALAAPRRTFSVVLILFLNVAVFAALLNFIG
jgi:DNA-binding transcriptional MerR regulator